MIQPTASFKENLQLLPSADHLVRIELTDPTNKLVATIENQPGKQGSLVVYQYLSQTFDVIDTLAAAHGIEVFAEHTADAKKNRGAHPNIDHLLDILDGAPVLNVRLIEA